MAALEALLDAVLARWGIPPAGVIAHSDMAPGRTSDPGPKFDWQRLARAGRSVWPEPGGGAAADWSAFREAASSAGYAAREGDWEAVLDVLRLRFRPLARGCALQPEDVAVARALGGCR
jgi:N-acetylmuramoyl-L-alanine amidase